jgi:hypothetical protein
MAVRQAGAGKTGRDALRALRLPVSKPEIVDFVSARELSGFRPGV